MDGRPFRCPECPTYTRNAEQLAAVGLPAIGVSGVLRSWASFDELNQNAERGCDLCTLFRQYLVHFNSIDKIRGSEGTINLYTYGDHFSLEFSAAFRGLITIPILGTEAFSETIRSVSEQSSPDVFRQASDWLHTCLRNHWDCLLSGAQTSRQRMDKFPRRLIDIASLDAVVVFNYKDRMKAGSVPVTETVKYCTLSYRWGDTPHSCVLKAPFENELTVALSSMPRTFQDAVTVAKRLGFRYLWIDALCIVQPSADDDTDWLEEGARMGVIYQNAVCTIAATSALNASQGFLEQTGKSFFKAEPAMVLKQDKDSRVETEAYVPIMAPRFYESISNSTLNRRGWVVQERPLSTRTLHFTEHGLFWECGSCKAHDVYGILQARGDFPSCRSWENLLNVARTRRTQHFCPVEWFHFIKHYSYANFTNPQDRLIALSSVAKVLQPYLGGHEYIAGLWRNDIIRGLAWKCWSLRPMVTDPTIPSWSWASAKGGIDLGVFSLRMYNYKLVEVLGVEAIPLLPSNPFGRLERGSIKLLGKLTIEWLDRRRQPGFDPDFNVFWDDPPPENPAQDSPETYRPQYYSILPLGRDKTAIVNKTHIGGLILEHTGCADVIIIDS